MRRFPPRALAIPVALVLAAVGAAAVLAGAPMYQSSATLIIDQPRAIAASGDGSVIDKLSRLRYKYSGLVDTERITVPVAQQTGVPERTVAKALYATVDPLSLLLVIGARGTNATQVRRLASAAANELVSYVQQEQAAAQIPATNRFTFAVVVPVQDVTKISPTSSRAGAVAVALGLIGLGGTLAATALLRRRGR